MFKRFFRYLRALFMGKMDEWENPEVIINETLREMKENQVKNRERAVQAITQKNNLVHMVEEEEKLVRSLESKAGLALKQGNRDLALQLLKEKGLHDQTLVQLRTSLNQAEETAEAVKTAIRHEEEQWSIKTAEALALKANMKQAQIQVEINKAMDGLQMSTTGQSWERAEERIRSMQSEAQARAEVAKTSVSSRIQSLNDVQVDADAERALAELEIKMGLAPAPVTVVAPVTDVAAATVPGSSAIPGASESDIDKQLRELEVKMQKLDQK